MALIGDAKQAMSEEKSGRVETKLTGRAATALHVTQSQFLYVFFPAKLQQHSTMARRMLHTFSFLILLAAAVVVQSNPQIAVIAQKLGDALIADSSLLYMMQEVFISSKTLPHDLVCLRICVTVGSELPGDCDNSSLLGEQSNFTYCHCRSFSGAVLL